MYVPYMILLGSANNSYLALVAHRHVAAIAAPVRMRARVHRRIKLVRPVFLRLVTLHLLVLFLNLGQRLGAELQSRIRSVHLEHDGILLGLVAVGFRFLCRRRAISVDATAQHRCVFAVARLMRQIKALLVALQISPPATAISKHLRMQINIFRMQ